MKIIYCVRHCEAEGQHPSAKLTERGKKQAIQLKDFFKAIPIERIVSSPYVRAIDSVKELQLERRIPMDIDVRLEERRLSSAPLDDWLAKLEASFQDESIKYDGGESGKEAMNRISEVVEEIPPGTTVLVSHGNLLSLLFKRFTGNFGFRQWKDMSNPDLYRLVLTEDGAELERVWGL
ncbi:histidine phosphatase family protein [Bacillus testis]|uniref:histidine phosphatase family protein n=1 Tax=Bacillus testis TaxID=1622072 RepID=UPI00067EEF90|nr:histidine phosphatase family protein [Bacillus testis]